MTGDLSFLLLSIGVATVIVLAYWLGDVVGKPLAYRHGEPVGVITGAENREDGLYIDFQIVNTAQGRDAATLVRTGASKGLSVGFTPIKGVEVGKDRGH